MELQEKEEKRVKDTGKLLRRSSKEKVSILQLKSVSSKFKGKHFAGKEFQNFQAVPGKELLTQTFLQHIGMVI